ncbi:hypothetical protein [Acidovorax sp. SDU_ACID1]|uniref:hypothetical protein n=1 Tax=Acidovorax sp. SDU_ACID1 TaxID=3136632 RepID=UPI003872D85C
MRLTISLGISSLAVWLLGPMIKASSFTTLFLAMADIAICTASVVLLLPAEPANPQEGQAPSSA